LAREALDLANQAGDRELATSLDARIARYQTMIPGTAR
jgi:hypothetical protein